MNVQEKPVHATSARLSLAALVLINLFNYIDRQVLSAVEPQISEELFGNVPNSSAEFKMGLLATAFLLSYMLLAPLFGFLADRVPRWRLIGFGVILWSLASGASGIPWEALGASAAASYVLLFTTRCFVGVGEAAYGPVAPAMIADLFPISRRGKIMAWFYVAISVGSALGYALGGEVQKYFGWRWAFYAVMPPGLLLGLWCFMLRDPPRGLNDRETIPTDDDPAPPAANSRPATWRDGLRVLQIPSYVYNTLGMTVMSFAMGGLAFWMPRYLKLIDVAPVGPVQPQTVFGIILALAGLLSTMAGGFLGDLMRTRWPGSYFLVSGAAMFLGFPMVLAVLSLPFPYAWLAIFGTVFCLFFNTGPTNTILANVTHPSVRASAFALNILIIHLFGDAISPPLIGWIADLFRAPNGRPNLEAGFVVVSALMLIGSLFWLWGARYLERDTRLAATRL